MKRNYIPTNFATQDTNFPNRSRQSRTIVSLSVAPSTRYRYRRKKTSARSTFRNSSSKSLVGSGMQRQKSTHSVKKLLIASLSSDSELRLYEKRVLCAKDKSVKDPTCRCLPCYKQRDSEATSARYGIAGRERRWKTDQTSRNQANNP